MGLTVYVNTRKRKRPTDNMVIITRPEMPLNPIKNIGGKEPTKDGELVFRSGKKRYGLNYTQSIIESLGGKEKLKGWTFIIKEPGRPPFVEKGGKPPKHLPMPHAKFRPSKRSYQVIGKINRRSSNG